MFYKRSTDDAGSFTFFDTVVGDYDLVAADSDVAPNEAPTQAITVTRGAVSEARFELSGDRAPIRGRVVRGGAPVADAVVVARHLEPSDVPLTRMWNTRGTLTRTDARGRFSIPGARRGELHELWAYPLGGGAGTIAQAAAGATLSLDVPETAAIAGVLSGTVPASFAVAVVPAGRADEHGYSTFRGTAGRWGFEAVPPGAYEVLFVANDACGSSQVTVGPNERREDVAFSFAPTVRLRGQVLVERTRKPVSGYYVRHEHADPGVGLGSMDYAKTRRVRSFRAAPAVPRRGRCLGFRTTPASTPSACASCPARRPTSRSRSPPAIPIDNTGPLPATTRR